MSVLGELVALVAPPGCAACRRSLRDAGAVVCAACLRRLPWLRGPRCPRCALPAGHAGRPCPAQTLGGGRGGASGGSGAAAGGGAAFARAWAPMAYEGVARDLVRALKFDGALAVASLLGAQVVATLPEELRGLPLVPVPPHASRRRRRGYDPAGELATAVARRGGLELAACLRRIDRAPRQLGSRRAARRSAPLRIEPIAPAPPRVLLVDDVHTTGATLHACALALRAGGAEWVAAVTYARAL